MTEVKKLNDRKLLQKSEKKIVTNNLVLKIGSKNC